MNLLPSLVMFAPSLFVVAITILAIANNLPGLGPGADPPCGLRRKRHGRRRPRSGCAGRGGPPAGGGPSWPSRRSSGPSPRRSPPACRSLATCHTCCQPATPSVRDLHALESRAQVFGTIIVAVESDDAGRRLAAAQLVRDRLRALPSEHAPRRRLRQRHPGPVRLGAPLSSGADRRADRRADELAARKARLNPLYVSLDDDAGTRRRRRRSASGCGRSKDRWTRRRRGPSTRRRSSLMTGGSSWWSRGRVFRPTRSRATSPPSRRPSAPRPRRAAPAARPSGSGSPATSPTPPRNIRRCWAGWCARPSSPPRSWRSACCCSSAPRRRWRRCWAC